MGRRTRRQAGWAGTPVLALALTLMGGGCSTAGEETSETDGGTGGETDGNDQAILLEPREQLMRISMALRGKRPSAADLAAVEADPAALEGIVNAYLEDPGFGETMRDLHNEALLVLADYFIYPAGFPAQAPVDSVDVYDLNRSIMESSLRLIEHVITSDAPYSDIVTADYTLANGAVAAVWGLPYAGDGSEWVTTQWDDGRGNAGILSDSWLYQRHSSTTSNANRGRANAISRALLCYDFLSRDIEVDSSINLADPEAVANAVVENQACATCHQTLDPLASFFRGFYPIYVPEEVTYPHLVYTENFFPQYLGVPMRDPGFFGTAADGLPALGKLIAEDPRFSLCAVERFYSYFHQIDLDEVPLEAAAALQEDFIAGGLNAKSLVKQIVLSDDFLVSHVESGDAADVRGVKKARPVQLRQLIHDLTGFRWRTDVYGAGLGTLDLLEDSFIGYQVLAGGLDSMYVTRPSHTYSATTSLVLQALAREAAHFRVDADFDAAPADRLLLTMVGDSDSKEELIRAQLVELYGRFFAESVEPDSAEIDEAYALWRGALDHTNDARRAWKVTLTAMLQDVKIAHY